jgi:hypothetical protein
MEAPNPLWISSPLGASIWNKHALLSHRYRHATALFGADAVLLPDRWGAKGEAANLEMLRLGCRTRFKRQGQLTWWGSQLGKAKK